MNTTDSYKNVEARTIPTNGFLSSGKIALTVKEATAASGLGKTTLYELMRTGALPRVKIGSRTLIRQDDLERILQSGMPIADPTPVSTH